MTAQPDLKKLHVAVEAVADEFRRLRHQMEMLQSDIEEISEALGEKLDELVVTDP